MAALETNTVAMSELSSWPAWLMLLPRRLPNPLLWASALGWAATILQTGDYASPSPVSLVHACPVHPFSTQ